MKISLMLVLMSLTVLVGLFWSRDHVRAEDLLVGAAAPEFSLSDAAGQQRQLKDFRGEWLLLYFYPKDDTPGCTQEACAFRDGYQELRRRGVQVVGVSLDDAASHQAFANKHRLPFPLLSDTDGYVAERYGALWSLGPIRFSRRHSFLIDAEGRIAEIYRSVDPDTHYRQVLDDLDRLSSINVD